MAKIFYQEDCNLSVLEGQKIAIIGYGSQGHAHALNLKESGCDVIIGLYEGSKSWKRAEEQVFQKIIDAKHIIIGKISGIDICHAAVHIPLDIINFSLIEHGTDLVKDTVAHFFSGKIKQ